MVYKKEIISVYTDDGLALGFIARRLHIFGANEFSHKWCVMPHTTLQWSGKYKNRKEASEKLKSLYFPKRA